MNWHFLGVQGKDGLLLDFFRVYYYYYYYY